MTAVTVAVVMLQRSRTRESAEIIKTNTLAPALKKLQRSRTRESAEMATTPTKKASLNVLQRSRTRESAEMFRNRFPHLRIGIASTEPHS